MFNKKSEYAQNKREKDSIIYISVNGRIRLTRADFASEEEFLRWKQWSDEDYYETERRGRGYYDNGVPLDENISAAGAVESAEDEYFREQMADEIKATRKALCQERMAKVKAPSDRQAVPPDLDVFGRRKIYHRDRQSRRTV